GQTPQADLPDEVTAARPDQRFAALVTQRRRHRAELGFDAKVAQRVEASAQAQIRGDEVVLLAALFGEARVGLEQLDVGGREQHAAPDPELDHHRVRRVLIDPALALGLAALTRTLTRSLAGHTLVRRRGGLERSSAARGFT